MSTAAQIDANRANAQHSTGPLTDSGKAASSQNARSHGLTSRELSLPEHEIADFEVHRAALLDDIKPLGPLETDLFEQILNASWKLRRIQRMEDEIFQNEANPLFNDESAKALDRLNRYQGTAERSYQRAMKQLRELQTNNSLRAFVPDSLETLLSGLVDITALTKRPRFKTAPSEDARMHTTERSHFDGPEEGPASTPSA